MRKTASFVLVAALGGGFGIATGQPTFGADAPDRSVQAEQAATPQLPNGFQLKDLSQLDNVRKELADVTEYALTTDDFGKIVDNLAVQNRDRLKDYKNQDFKTMNDIVTQLNKDWNAKYGHDFNIKRANNVFTDREVIVQGVVTEANVAAANFPVPAEMTEQARTAAAKVAADGQQGQVQQVAAQNLKDAKGVAIVRLPAEGSVPELNVSLIEEGGVLGSGVLGGWHIAVPDNLTSQQIHTQLRSHLTFLSENSAQWPADETVAYRAVSRHVLMALYDVNNPKADATPNK